MPSIIEGYTYDIFISYRQKDNKGDRWVSEFVETLKTELESTFKEEISVYFDINPHDGLLETNDVDAVDFYNYKILGACNPPFAYKALQAEDKIGTMLPCNVIVQEKVAGQVEVSAVDPVASMLSIENKDLQAIATEIRTRLKKVIEHL